LEPKFNLDHVKDLPPGEINDGTVVEEPELPAEQKQEYIQRKKLLLVEDNPISQNLELKILREVGYDVEAVSTGFAAIEAVKTGMFNLVLMDVEMTDMDGITATKKIRDWEDKGSRIPIIAVTAHSSMKDREKCLAAGMDDYIAKPINIHFLKITIDQWLNTLQR
jgi:CheY-like chemotaxis protein